jgi:outer membrane putative beta-barrel porin/alpha-amylase
MPTEPSPRRVRHLMRLVGAMAGCMLAAGTAVAQEKDPRPAAGIQDNSFLIEEAYNQEPGVVQHISTLQRQYRNWFYTFTQEWPLGSQTHQFSYNIPLSWIRDDVGARQRGLGDLQFNYRYQFWTETDTRPAFAPRISLITPSGDASRGLGDGSLGYQINLPFSKIVSDRVTLNFNAGTTHWFDINDRSPTNYNLGGSVIYAVTRDFNLMLEMLGQWEQSVNDLRLIENSFTFTLNPGFRFAINLPDDSQVVAGFAVPIAFTQGTPTNYGLFFYLSVEHDFLPKKLMAKK